ncbi:MAG: 30S ribosomal protein S1 [Lachnospiraceae bacterium]|nr:30S ribosomal protein S1 [Lachnospiraceae bacterium]
MSEEQNFEQLLNESFAEGSLNLKVGDIVKGKVISVSPESIVLDIGVKGDGLITRNEYSNDTNLDLTTVVHEGDELETKVLKGRAGDEQILLTYKRLAVDRGNKKLEEAFNEKTVLKGKVVRVLDGGLSVSFDGARVFIPASLVSDTFEKDLTKYNGQEIEFIITEFNPRRRRVIGDRRCILLERKKERQQELLSKLHEGDIIEGSVKNVTDFGAFVDLGDIDGLLHISEMSWGHVENPKKVFKVGEKLRVFIKGIQGTKIALSLKFPDQNPWLDAAEKYKVGNIVKGKVARMTDFGAFVELEPGIDALLHVSQISRDHIEKPSDVLKSGQEVEAKVVDFNEDDHKISLSIKAFLNSNGMDVPDVDVPAEDEGAESAPEAAADTGEEAPAAEAAPVSDNE